VGLLSGLAFAPFAMLLASTVVVAKQISGAAAFLTTGFAFLGGFFFPVDLLPNWMAWISEVLPFLPAIELLRHLLVCAPLVDPALQVVRLALFAAVLLPLSILGLRQAVKKR
jgi:ABC-type polysaccharide/polyol phosphate export permease